MKPAWSVIVFTVLSGAGLGLLAMLALADLALWAVAPAPGVIVAIGALALAFSGAGLASSTLHLANPRNAWRALSRVGSSWLSREAVLALACLALAVAYLAAAVSGGAGLRRALAVLLLLLALATVYSTGMIYGCLRTVPRWNHPLVPVLYVAFALASGAVLLLAVAGTLGAADAAMARIALLLVAAAAGLKFAYYLSTGRAGAPPTIAAATGLQGGGVRLFDAGHSHGTFLTREFMFELARERALILRWIAFVLGSAVPTALLAASATPASAVLASVLALAGLLVERWLFFAEAQHVVRLFHGQQTLAR